MSFSFWLRKHNSSPRQFRRGAAPHSAERFRPQIETLEDRSLLSGGSFSPPVVYDTGVPFGGDPVAFGGSPVAVADFDGDGKLDIASLGGLGVVSVLRGKGDGTFQSPLITPVPGKNFYDTLSLAVGDFNGDGKPDLAVSTVGSVLGHDNVSVLLGNGDGTFQKPQDFPVGYVPIDVVVGDFNRDGKPDLAVANAADNTVSVLLGNGDGTFQPARNYTVGSDPTALAVGDFNGDGKPDLVVNGTSGLNVLLGNGDGSFQATEFPGGVSSGGVGDFNGDGKLDLVMAYGEDVSPHTGRVSVELNALVTTTAMSGPASSTYGQPVTYTATVTSGGVPVTAGTVTFFRSIIPLTGALPVNANGQATFSFVPPSLGGYPIIASYSGPTGGAGTTGFGPSTANLELLVNPAVLSASGVNFSATAGVPFTGGVATVTTAYPLAVAASLTATITWGDGTTSIGAVAGTGPLTVTGAHTYADPGTYAVTVQISHPLGYTNMVTVSATATVTSLGREVTRDLTGDIGFWHEATGQALINSFNGGPNATSVGTWLATTFGNLYWSLNGSTNAQVAAYYQSLFALTGPNAQAEVLATALNVYTTTQSLGGTAGLAYGFTVTDAGLGAYSFNVGAYGDVFGMANNSTHTVYAFLQVVNQNFGFLFYPSQAKLVTDFFDLLNKTGRI
jgi:hypothetical protein